MTLCCRNTPATLATGSSTSFCASSEEMLFVRHGSHGTPLDIHCILINPALHAFEPAFPVLQSRLAEMAVPGFRRLNTRLLCARYQGMFAQSSPPQVLHRDDEMYLFREQTQMESFLGYPMAVGRATTLEGDKNNSGGVGSLTKRWGALARVRGLSFCFDVVGRRKKRIESSPNKTQAVRFCASAQFMSRYGVAPCYAIRR